MVVVIVVAIICDKFFDADADADADVVAYIFADGKTTASDAKASICPLAGLLSTIWVSA